MEMFSCTTRLAHGRVDDEEDDNKVTEEDTHRWFPRKERVRTEDCINRTTTDGRMKGESEQHDSLGGTKKGIIWLIR